MLFSTFRYYNKEHIYKKWIFCTHLLRAYVHISAVPILWVEILSQGLCICSHLTDNTFQNVVLTYILSAVSANSGCCKIWFHRSLISAILMNIGWSLVVYFVIFQYLIKSNASVGVLFCFLPIFISSSCRAYFNLIPIFSSWVFCFVLNHHFVKSSTCSGLELFDTSL